LIEPQTILAAQPKRSSHGGGLDTEDLSPDRLLDHFQVARRGNDRLRMADGWK
jgi:hypothetical protein